MTTKAAAKVRHRWRALGDDVHEIGTPSTFGHVERAGWPPKPTMKWEASATVDAYGSRAEDVNFARRFVNLDAAKRAVEKWLAGRCNAHAGARK